MNRTRTQITHFLIALMLALTLPATAHAAENGFQSIFNGENLSGWKGAPDHWSVEDGAITGRTTRENPVDHTTFLIWQGNDVSNFILKLKYRIQGGNSGILYRSRVVNAEEYIVGGYQADIDALDPLTGMLYEGHGRGALARRGQKVKITPNGKKKVIGSFGTARELGRFIHPGQWNTYTIIARGEHIIHKVNGHIMIEVFDHQDAENAASGPIALQLHAGHPMTIQFKNVRLKRLEPKATKSEDRKARDADNHSEAPGCDFQALTCHGQPLPINEKLKKELRALGTAKGERCHATVKEELRNIRKQFEDLNNPR